MKDGGEATHFIAVSSIKRCGGRGIRARIMTEGGLLVNGNRSVGLWLEGDMRSRFSFLFLMWEKLSNCNDWCLYADNNNLVERNIYDQGDSGESYRIDVFEEARRI